MFTCIFRKTGWLQAGNSCRLIAGSDSLEEQLVNSRASEIAIYLRTFTRASVITGLDYWTLKFSALKTVSMLSDDIYLPVELTMMTHHSHQSLHSSGPSNSKVHAGIPHFCPADPLSHLCHQWSLASFYHPHHLSTIHSLASFYHSHLITPTHKFTYARFLRR